MNNINTSHQLPQSLSDAALCVIPASRANARLVLGGAAVLALGSMLPWATVSAPILGTYSVNGLHGGGLFTLVIAATIAYVARNATRSPLTRRQSWVILSTAALAALIVLLNLANVASVAGKDTSGLMQVSPGIGLFIAGAGVVSVIVGAIGAGRTRRLVG